MSKRADVEEGRRRRRPMSKKASVNVEYKNLICIFEEAMKIFFSSKFLLFFLSTTILHRQRAAAAAVTAAAVAAAAAAAAAADAKKIKIFFF